MSEDVKIAKPVKAKADDSQKEFLHAARAKLGVQWDELAELAEIAPRALKNYRMPGASQNYRPMPKVVRRVIEQLLAEHESKPGP